MEKIDRKTVEKMTQQLIESMRKRRNNKMNEKMNEKMNNQCKNYSDSNLLLNDAMLYNKRYDIFALEKNIYNLSMKTILQTQYLTADFCVKYILSNDYVSCIEDTYICVEDVLNAQKHITLADIKNLYRMKIYSYN